MGLRLLHLPTARYITRIYLDFGLKHVMDGDGFLLSWGFGHWSRLHDADVIKRLLAKENLVVFRRKSDVEGVLALDVFSYEADLENFCRDMPVFELYPSLSSMLEIIEVDDV